jgi:diadenosine tetraphosphate (Ap4A) HIT family hydrolase
LDAAVVAAHRRQFSGKTPGLMSSSPFASLSDLEQRFTAGLTGLLENHDGLGVYILALANAAQDARLWEQLHEALLCRHRRHQASLVDILRQGRGLAEPDDDLLVFLKLLAIGFEHLHPAEQRRLGGDNATGATPWEIQFNPIRALRPARMSDARADGVMRPFDVQGFHFNKPFLAKEVLWEGELAGKPARLLYNKFPFAPLHGLLVPEPALQRPQFLSPELHGWAWEVTRQAGERIPGFGLAYNSYGAFASVNHLHFQTFVRERPLPLQIAKEGGYPLACWRFVDPEAAWFQLDELHQQGTPYNLIHNADSLHVIPRRRQGETTPEPWSSGFAWSELAGAFTVSSRADYEGLNADTIRAALQRLAL